MYRCCYQCEKRHINCHSDCTAFLEEKAKLDKAKEEKAKEAAFRNNFIAMVADKKYKEGKKRNTRKF